MADRRTETSERQPAAPERARPAAVMPPANERPTTEHDDGARRAPSKFGAAAEGWDAYNSWLDRVRQPTPPSRQAVISKALYSVSSYKNWADQARGAFDKPK